LAHKATTASSAGTASDITIDDIRAAAKVIDGIVERTPTHFSRTLSKIAGCEIWLKFENLQFTASFKERGALNKLTSLNAEQRKRGVVAMSAGNHAQGVAYHAGRLGIPATIVMPEGTPFNKVKHTKNFGARVVLDGMTLMQASDRAHVIEKSRVSREIRAGCAADRFLVHSHEAFDRFHASRDFAAFGEGWVAPDHLG